MRIAISKTYTTRAGDLVKIIEENSYSSRGGDIFRPFLGSNGLRYTNEGRVDRMGFTKTMDDLDSEVVVNRSQVEVFEMVIERPRPVPQPPVVVVETPVSSAAGLVGGFLAGLLLSSDRPHGRFRR